MMNHQTPPAGTELKCLVCALDKPWGVFDEGTGASVCKGCRDAARQTIPQKRESMARIAEAIAHRRGMRRGAPPISNVLDVLPATIKEDLLDDAEGVYETLFPNRS